jgi:hypothetical protein
LDGATVSTLLMAANMTVVVAAWMYLRGHRLRLIGKMVAGVNVGLLAMVPLWSGANSHHTPMMAGHGLMFLGIARRHAPPPAALFRTPATAFPSEERRHLNSWPCGHCRPNRNRNNRGDSHDR